LLSHGIRRSWSFASPSRKFYVLNGSDFEEEASLTLEAKSTFVSDSRRDNKPWLIDEFMKSAAIKSSRCQEENAHAKHSRFSLKYGRSDTPNSIGRSHTERRSTLDRDRAEVIPPHREEQRSSTPPPTIDELAEYRFGGLGAAYLRNKRQAREMYFLEEDNYCWLTDLESETLEEVEEMLEAEEERRTQMVEFGLGSAYNDRTKATSGQKKARHRLQLSEAWDITEKYQSWLEQRKAKQTRDAEEKAQAERERPPKPSRAHQTLISLTVVAERLFVSEEEVRDCIARGFLEACTILEDGDLETFVWDASLEAYQFWSERSLTLQAVAEMLGVSPSQIKTMLVRGVLPGVKTLESCGGKSRRYMWRVLYGDALTYLRKKQDIIKGYVPARDLATKLSVAPETVRRWLVSGFIRGMKLQGYTHLSGWWVKQEDVTVITDQWNTDGYLNVCEAAEQLGMTEFAMRAMIRDGRISAVKFTLDKILSHSVVEIEHGDNEDPAMPARVVCQEGSSSKRKRKRGRPRAVKKLSISHRPHVEAGWVWHVPIAEVNRVLLERKAMSLLQEHQTVRSDLIGLEDAARMLKIDIYSIRKRLYEGTLPGRKIVNAKGRGRGRFSWRVCKDFVDNYWRLYRKSIL